MTDPQKQTIIVVGEDAEEAAAWLRAMLDKGGDSDITVTTELPLVGPIRAAFRAQFEAIHRAAEAEWEAAMEALEAQQRKQKGEQS